MNKYKEGNMVRIQKSIGIICLVISMVSCQPAIPTSSTNTNTSTAATENKVILTLAPVTESDEPITLIAGSQVQLYKDDILLVETALGEDNQLIFDQLKETPPYRYVVNKAKIKDISFNRLLPVGTQGGLVTAPTTDALIAPGTITTIPDETPQSPDQLKIEEEISFEGTIKQDLRTNQSLSLESVIVKKEKE